MFKHVNKKIKTFSKIVGFSIISIGIINLYKSQYNTVLIDLKEVDLTIKIPNNPVNNAFEITESFDISEYEYNRISKSLYNPPLTSKLFPKSNLYGHELIRYFDF
jgi:hypothetical protein